MQAETRMAKGGCDCAGYPPAGPAVWPGRQYTRGEGGLQARRDGTIAKGKRAAQVSFRSACSAQAFSCVAQLRREQEHLAAHFVAVARHARGSRGRTRKTSTNRRKAFLQEAALPRETRAR